MRVERQPSPVVAEGAVPAQSRVALLCRLIGNPAQEGSCVELEDGATGTTRERRR